MIRKLIEYNPFKERMQNFRNTFKTFKRSIFFLKKKNPETLSNSRSKRNIRRIIFSMPEFDCENYFIIYFQLKILNFVVNGKNRNGN